MGAEKNMRMCADGDRVTAAEFESIYPRAFIPLRRVGKARSGAVQILAVIGARAREGLPLAVRFETWDQERKPLNEGGFTSAKSRANDLLRRHYRDNEAAIAARLAKQGVGAVGLRISLQSCVTGLGTLYELRWEDAARKRAPTMNVNLLSAPAVAEALRQRGIDPPLESSRHRDFIVKQPHQVAHLTAIWGLVADSFPEKAIPFDGFSFLWWWWYPTRTWMVTAKGGELLAAMSIWGVSPPCLAAILKGNATTVQMVEAAIDHDDTGPHRNLYMTTLAFASEEAQRDGDLFLKLLLGVVIEKELAANRVGFPLRVTAYPQFPGAREALKLFGFNELCGPEIQPGAYALTIDSEEGAQKLSIDNLGVSSTWFKHLEDL